MGNAAAVLVLPDFPAVMLGSQVLAGACGYVFVVGVSSAGHEAVLEAQDRLFDIVVTRCKR